MNFKLIEISERQFAQLAELLTNTIGIKLPPEKRIMFQSRMQSRLNELGFNSFETYASYLLKPENKMTELPAMIDLVSTNKTEFFREKEHFDLLLSTILPDLVSEQKQFIDCWSAGSSNGQEAFSLAMILEEFKLKNKLLSNYHILGTDVSSRMLKIAKNGIYPFSSSTQIPSEYLKRYVLKSKDVSNPKIKIMKSIQSKIEFRYSNLMDDNYNIQNKFQIIFIRNTLIYFNQKNQFEVLKKVVNKLVPGGFLFIGHSESLINMDLPLKVIWPSVYQKVL
ncbi:CheR family methyltransferase [Sunxiuqinia sp. A32]|uniref:CheR family methyltransferase n=1 Tax=Sunxiuqinia sp. A32 TaxID=3461496 RepID=UPI0040454991